MLSLTIAKDSLALSALRSRWDAWRQGSPSGSRGKAARPEAFAIPPSVPLSSGLDAAAFQRHYASALQDRKYRLQQGAFTLWYFYVAPVLLGMVPGKLYADLLQPATADDMVRWWIPTLLTQLVITPLLMRYRRMHKGYKRHQIFYTAALEACLREDVTHGR